MTGVWSMRMAAANTEGMGILDRSFYGKVEGLYASSHGLFLSSRRQLSVFADESFVEIDLVGAGEVERKGVGYEVLLVVSEGCLDFEALRNVFAE